MAKRSARGAVGRRRGRPPPAVYRRAADGRRAAASPAAVADAAPGREPPGHPGLDLAPVVGTNLRRLRTARGLSLEGLAALSGVSRAMLGQMELGKSAPTINVLWKIACALDVPFSTFISGRRDSGTIVLRAGEAKLLTSRDRRFTSRALFPFDQPRRVEFYELRLAPQASERAEPHPPGTAENLVVARGGFTIVVDGEEHALAAGDAIVFGADVPHRYVNPLREESTAYLVMTYAETIG